jgi:hypothetical protein
MIPVLVGYEDGIDVLIPGLVHAGFVATEV